jgi:hypothetical protein
MANACGRFGIKTWSTNQGDKKRSNAIEKLLIGYYIAFQGRREPGPDTWLEEWCGGVA